MKQGIRFLSFVLVIVGGLFVPPALQAAPQRAQAPILVDRAGSGYNGVEVTLSADAAPSPGGVVTLTLVARPLRDAPDLAVDWELPDGGRLLDGPSMAWLGPVSAGQTISVTRRVQVDGEGIYQVRARAFYFPNDATALAATGVLFFDVNADRPSASDLDPRVLPYNPPADKPTIDKSTRLDAPAAADDDPCFNVSGFLARENRMPVAVVVPEGPPPPAVPRYIGQYQNQTGQAAPVHHILVEMREEDNFSDDSYGHTVTDANGKFTFNFCDDDGFANDTLELYFRVCAEVWDGPNRVARIEDWDPDELFCWDSGTIDSDGGAVDFDVNLYKLGQTQASVFNIADSLFWAARYWNNNAANSPVMDRSVTVYWQPGRGQKGSFYNDDRTTMVLADDPSSTDEWDDSVIIHEWGHFADHQFSCNQNPGGAHSLPGVNAGMNGTRLAFGEGYPDYYQSAARTLMTSSSSVSFYVDPDGPTVDLENMRGVTASDRDEGAIAALMWDLQDAANDGQDTINPGHAVLQRVYTSADFRNNAQCDMRRFLQVWRKLGLPTDAATAATVVQNVNVAFASLPPIAAAAAEGPEAVATDGPAAASAFPPLDYRWWEQATMVVDTSASMAGPAGAPKINSVKTIIGEQVSDLAPKPQGTEFNIYTFDAGGAPIKPLLEGKFFANQIMPAVNGMVANGPDAGCPVPGLGALSQAIQTKFDGEAWLYTDGDSADSLTPEQLRQALVDRRLRASIVLLGGCGSPARKPPDVTGAEKTYLKLAADGSQPSGIVPYLLTSMMSGGQFIYVAPDQLANAVDMVRAQLSHTAGAGRWSDYVSTAYTYRWDRLEPWEYQWFPAESLGQNRGQLYSSGMLLDLPVAFDFFGNETDTVRVSEDGMINMSPCTLPNPDFCLNFYPFINILASDLKWAYYSDPNRIDPNESITGPAVQGPQVWVYTANLGIDEWHIISTQGTALYGPGDTGYRAYQVWLNLQTGEIRFQYDDLRNEAATSEIGLENGYAFVPGSVVVSKNDINGASDDMGYKFTPAPPQPSKTYEVDVDPLISSVVFLQTGYSGDFAPLVVTRPDGAAVDCADTANVRCITVNSKPGDRMVQFVQVNTAGKGGLYKATVAVGPSGGGTFSFNALAASDLRVSSPDNHTLARKAHTFIVDLGRPADGGTLQGWLRAVDGAAFGDPFVLYDDGAHGDGEANDGRFGSDSFTPPRSGAAYLWVEGEVDGVTFKRSDPAPFNFQPVEVTASPDQEAYYGESVAVSFPINNRTNVRLCYALDFNVPAGWTLSTPFTNGHCVDPGATSAPYAYVSRSLTPDRAGETGEVTMTATEQYGGMIAGSATTRVTLFRPPVELEWDNRQLTPLRPNGADTAELELVLHDDRGGIVGISGPFNGEITVDGGTVTLPTGMYADGRLRVIFEAGNQPGTATIDALAEGGLMASTTIELAEPVAATITLAATPVDVSDVNSSALLVTVLDTMGNPAAGETVRLSVSDDDGDRGTIGGGEVFEGATDKKGQLKATFAKKAGAEGTVIVRAELLGEGGAVVREASVLLYLSEPPPALKLFLPVAIRN
jgi:hypothetical protein